MAEEVWTEFREQLERFLELTGWPAKRLAAEAKVGPSTISQFRNGEGGLQKRVYKRLRERMKRERPELFDDDVSESTQNDALDTVRLSGIILPDEIPVVDILKFPLGKSEAQMHDALQDARDSWHNRGPRDPKDPGLFYLTVHERIGRAEPGDDLKISPKAVRYDGARVAVEFPDHVEIARFLIVGPSRMVRLSSGQKLPEGECKILGVVVGFASNRVDLEQ